MKSSRFFLYAVVFLFGITAIFLMARRFSQTNIPSQKLTSSILSASQMPPPATLPKTKILSIPYHTFQTFNNCAPAALSIALSYYGIHKNQEELAADLRPYNNPKGINDDKSTTPDELGAKAAEYGLTPYFRANGTIDLLKELIAHDVPVVMRTLLKPGEDFAHYRVIKGYDDTTGEIIQDDSFQGKNIRYSYDEFLKLWKPFNYEYLVLVPESKRKAIEIFLGDEVNEAVAWRSAVQTAESELRENPEDVEARFNLSVALYYLEDYKGSATAFEEVEDALPKHMLWYQIEPIRTYAALSDRERVFTLSDKILNDGNPAFSELYILRGEMYVAEGNVVAAKGEFKKAVLYNKNLKAAQEALISVSGR